MSLIPSKMKKLEEQYDVVVIGGGLAGFCAAIASARLGKATCLVQNRPVFGGNSSSEIRVTPHGASAFHAYARETGIISELLIEERAINHEPIFENGWTNSVWDLTLYNMAQCTKNLSLHLNSDVFAVKLYNKRNIQSVFARQLNAEKELELKANIFIDASGDGIVAEMSGCEYRIGSESKSEFGEIHAPEFASKDVMGSSIHFKTKDMGRPCDFVAPDWAIKYEDASFFYKQGRLPKEIRGGYWWIEIGVPFNTIEDNELIRTELTKHALGVWDWMKNKDPKTKELAKNFALDWIGQVPGKRESRRIMGQYLMTEHDPQNCTVFEDEIAFGGWFIDLHTPGGLLAANSEPASNENYSTFSDYAVKSYAGPYGIPLRSLISKDLDNLMMAGRNISVTHAALGTVRVMNTTALMGQAAGTAAALSLNNHIPISEAPVKIIKEIQQQLLRDGCFLPNYKNEDEKDFAKLASVSASSEASVYLLDPTVKNLHNGLNIWRDQPQYNNTILENRKGQLIAIGTDKIDTIELLINNLSENEQILSCELYFVEHIWDYRAKGLTSIASASLKVPLGQNWIKWHVDINKLPVGSYLRLDVFENSKLEWLLAGDIESGHMAMYQISDDKMRRFGNGHTFSFKISPAQACFGPANIINGVTRPHKYTNLWKSDPALSLPQWVDLKWETPMTFTSIELTFPGHLIREYHAYDPFYLDPQCPRDYELQILNNIGWETIVTVKNNYQRHRKHVLKNPILANNLRVLITRTNGDKSAQIYEVRCY